MNLYKKPSVGLTLLIHAVLLVILVISINITSNEASSSQLRFIQSAHGQNQTIGVMDVYDSIQADRH